MASALGADASLPSARTRNGLVLLLTALKTEAEFLVSREIERQAQVGTSEVETKGQL